MPQLTEQYGHVDRVSVARAILSSASCATAGFRSNPRREKPAPPTSAPLRKVLRENSIAHPPSTSIAYRNVLIETKPESRLLPDFYALDFEPWLLVRPQTLLWPG